MKRINGLKGIMFNMLALVGMVGFNDAGFAAEAPLIRKTSYAQPVDICTIAGDDCQPMTDSSELKQGQMLRIGAKGALTIQVKDGTTFALNDSKIALIKFASEILLSSKFDLQIEFLSMASYNALHRGKDQPAQERAAETLPIEKTSFSPPVKVCAIDDDDEKKCEVMTDATILKEGQMLRIGENGAVGLRTEGIAMSVNGPKVLLIKSASKISATPDINFVVEILSTARYDEVHKKGTPQLPPLPKELQPKGHAPSSPKPSSPKPTKK